MHTNEDEATAWQFYHENSKSHDFDIYHQFNIGYAGVLETLSETLPHEDCLKISLNSSIDPMDISLCRAIRERRSARSFSGGSLAISKLGALLTCAYGCSKNRHFEGGFPRTPRLVPSGGALYPLDIYCLAMDIEGLDAGIYYYDPLSDELCVRRAPVVGSQLQAAFLYPDLIRNASLVVVIAATFQRNCCKYGEKGYRLALFEAGHVAQNINLACVALDLKACNVAGFIDDKLNELLCLDGSAQAALYTVIIGD